MSQKSGIDPSIISLPKGGGALHGIGEKFSADLHTGTGNFSVPLWTPPGRNGLTPSLALQYSSGAGNGSFGLGWSLSVPGVSRKTSKGVPRYQDDHDVFVLSGVEDLVALPPAPQSPANATRYRPRTEGLFARIHHHVSSSDDYWKVETGDGLISLYGTPGARGADPAAVRSPSDPRRVFAWRLTETRDPFGNVIQYGYQRAQPASGAPVRGDQLYLSEVRYADYGDPANPSFLIRVRFAYDERPDPFSEHRAGFEVRTTLRCVRVEVSTHADRARRVRTTHLDYLDQLGRPAHELPLNKVSLLSRVRVVGHDDERPAAWGPGASELPPLELGYTRYEPWSNERYLPITGAEVPPGSLGHPEFELADLFGRGLPDVFQVASGAPPRYWKNLGDGRFDRPRTLENAPVGLSLADTGVQLLDANGDGHPDLVVTRAGAAGYFPFDPAGGWDRGSFQPYPVAPTISLEDPSVRLLDLTGDGVTDALRTGEQLECFFQGARGWSEVRALRRQPAGSFPNVDFRDPRVKIADMTGDGLSDIVLVHSGSVEYWPNLGHGNWGPRVSMTGGPNLPPHHDPRRLLVGDLDGDGVADLAYVDFGQVTLWINQSGNSWSDPIVLCGTPPISDLDALRLVDLLGAGTLGVLWTHDRGSKLDSTYKFLDPTHGVKPYLLDEVRNNMGATTRVEYAPSTRFRLADEEDPQTRWKTTLPFPVQVVAKVVVEEVFSENRLTTEYAYHHGYWDGEEREFRGFGRVDQRDTELVRGQSASPPVETRTWFHLGTELDLSAEHWVGDVSMLATLLESQSGALAEGHQRDALRALRGRVLRSETYAHDGSPRAERPYSVAESAWSVRREGAGSSGVLLPLPLGERTTQWERGDDPMTNVRVIGEHDRFGRPVAQANVAVARGRRWDREGAGGAPHLASLERTTFATRDDDLLRTDRLASVTRFEVVNDGSSSAPALAVQALRGTRAVRLLEQELSYYDGPAHVGLAVGQMGPFGTLTRQEKLVLTEERIVAAYGALPASIAGTFLPVYPDEYRQAFPEGAGCRFDSGGGEAARGWFANTKSAAYDVQRGPRGRGVLVATRDPLGHECAFEHDGYDLLPVRVLGPTGLVTRGENDYRVLAPRAVVDANDNRSEVSYTPLGLPASIWLRGKGAPGEGDTDEAPCTRLDYELRAYVERGQPVSVRTTRRVYHASDRLANPALRDETISRIEFTDGLGRLLQSRSQAEDTLVGDPITGDVGLSADQDAPLAPVPVRARIPSELDRVTVSGWQTYDNKGRVIEKYEPRFAWGWDYGRPTPAERGERVRLSYDPRGLVIRTEQPDGTVRLEIHGIPVALDRPEDFEPSPWESYLYDENDNAGRTHPDDAARTSHYWNTPSSQVVDALGRVIARVERAGQLPSEWLLTQTAHDLTGRITSVIDALGRTALGLVYDHLGRVLRTERPGGGASVAVFDAAGGERERRDARGALILQSFDPLGRLERMWARDREDAPLTLRQWVLYGEGLPLAEGVTRNLRGRAYRHHDEAGIQATERCDLHGNVTESIRHVVRDDVVAGASPHFTMDWQPQPGSALTDLTATLLDPREYRTSSTWDAQSQVREVRLPEDGAGRRRVLRFDYSRAAAVERVELEDGPEISRVAYDARGRPTLVTTSNGVMTRLTYAPRSGRLVRQRSERFVAASGELRPAGGALQDLAYSHDPGGNLLTVIDGSPGSGTPSDPGRFARTLTYDAIYRLISATGREADDVTPDVPWFGDPRPVDRNRTRRYREEYGYDAVRNLTTLVHQAPGGSYRRTFDTEAATDRLTSMSVGSTVFSYAHDPAGNVTAETTSRRYAYDHSNRMVSFAEAPSGGSGARAQYLYDGAGARLKKIVSKPGGQTESTTYLDGYYERHQGNRAGTSWSNSSVNLLVGGRRLATERTGTASPGDSSPRMLYFLEDHLGSSTIAADQDGRWTNREEYTPYGQTSLGGFARKRYRFTGKERDEESGLAFHGARYYAPGLGRWTSTDPHLDATGFSPYVYAAANPMRYVDPDGRQILDMGDESGEGVFRLAPTKFGGYVIREGGHYFRNPVETAIGNYELGEGDPNRIRFLEDAARSPAVQRTPAAFDSAWRTAGADHRAFALLATSIATDGVAALTRLSALPSSAMPQGISKQGAIRQSAPPPGTGAEFVGPRRNLRPPGAVHDLAKTTSAHTLEGAEAQRILGTGKKGIHVFNPDVDLAALEARVWSEGVFQGSVKRAPEWSRYYLVSDQAIGFRRQLGRPDIPLYVVEIKMDANQQYHLVPRPRPAK